MWFFGKKKVNEETVAPSAALTPDPVNSQSISTPENMALLFDALRGVGAHTSIAYAQMQGFSGKTLGGHNFKEFIDAIEKSPEFTEEGIEFAVEHMLSEAEAGLNSSSGDMFIYGMNADRNTNMRKIFEPIRSEIYKASLRKVIDRIGFDPRVYIESKALLMRGDDISSIVQLLEQKKAVLKPILLRAKARSKNKYGDFDPQPVIDEVDEFVQTYLPQGTLPFFYVAPPMGIILSVVEEWLEDVPPASEIPEFGIDFEHWCAARLEEQGWSTTVSKASGDQGVDVIAIKEEFSVAIQCKRYNQPVGNKAVQEAFAGMRHYNADAAAVIATGGFTRSANELAKNTRVLLLDAENILAFTEQVRR